MVSGTTGNNFPFFGSFSILCILRSSLNITVGLDPHDDSTGETVHSKPCCSCGYGRGTAQRGRWPSNATTPGVPRTGVNLIPQGFRCLHGVSVCQQKRAAGDARLGWGFLAPFVHARKAPNVGKIKVPRGNRQTWSTNEKYNLDHNGAKNRIAYI